MKARATGLQRSREALARPLQRIDLDAANEHLPVEMGAGRTPGTAYQSNHLAGLDHVADPDLDLALVPVTGIDAPAMIDNRCISSNG